MKAIAKFAGLVALVLVFSLLSSTLLTMLISGIAAMHAAPAGTEFEDALRSFMHSGTPFALAVEIVPSSFVFFMIAFRLSRGRREELRLWGAKPLDFVIVVVGMIAISTAAGALVSLLGLVENGALAELDDLFTRMPFVARLSMLPATALCPGVAEEMLFRGWVLGRGQKLIGTMPAVLISALAFGAAHMDPGHAIAASLMGGYLAFAVLRTGSLYVTMVAHVLNNALATLAPELNGSGVSDLSTSIAALVGGLAVGAVMIAILIRRHPLAPSARA